MSRAAAVVFGLGFASFTLGFGFTMGWAYATLAACIIGFVGWCAAIRVHSDGEERTIFYLVDLYDARVVSSHEGKGDDPGPMAIAEAEKRTKATGHTHTLARLVISFQDNCEGPARSGGVAETN